MITLQDKASQILEKLSIDTQQKPKLRMAIMQFIASAVMVRLLQELDPKEFKPEEQFPEFNIKNPRLFSEAMLKAHPKIQTIVEDYLQNQLEKDIAAIVMKAFPEVSKEGVQ